MDQPGKVANPARGQLNRENNIQGCWIMVEHLCRSIIDYIIYILYTVYCTCMFVLSSCNYRWFLQKTRTKAQKI